MWRGGGRHSVRPRRQPSTSTGSLRAGQLGRPSTSSRPVSVAKRRSRMGEPPRRALRQTRISCAQTSYAHRKLIHFQPLSPCGRRWPGKRVRYNEWNFCLEAARIAADQAGTWRNGSAGNTLQLLRRGRFWLPSRVRNAGRGGPTVWRSPVPYLRLVRLRYGRSEAAWSCT
jgi:hypothetical protein